MRRRTKIICTIGPATASFEGLKACKALSDKGVPVNVTLIFSVTQAVLAAKAGAAYVSPFIGRIDDTGHDVLSSWVGEQPLSTPAARQLLAIRDAVLQ